MMTSDTLDLFEQPEPVHVAPREVRIDPPSAPGSESSRRGAEKAKSHASTQCDGIMAILGRLRGDACLSRDEIIVRFGGYEKLSVNAACGRLNHLVTLGYLTAVMDGAVSTAGNKVTGYKLSAAGRRRINTKRSA